MLVAIAASAGLWGFLGAFIYAGPQFATCVFASQETHAGWLKCGLEFVIALIIGVIGAEAFGALILEMLHRDGPSDLRAVATIIGLLANKVAPMIVAKLPDALMEMATRMLKGSAK